MFVYERLCTRTVNLSDFVAASSRESKYIREVPCWGAFFFISSSNL